MSSPRASSLILNFLGWLVGVVALTVGGSGEVAFVGGEQRVSDDTDSQRGH